MTEYLYLEGANGISGDMTVAALLDLGGSREKLDAVLQSLRLDGFDYQIEQKLSYSICGCDFDVHLHHSEHHHEEHYHEHHHHEHRHLSDVYEIIDRGSMSEKARSLAKKYFESWPRLKERRTAVRRKKCTFMKSAPLIQLSILFPQRF